MTETRDIRAVLLDAAGTLIAPRESVGETYARFARSFGIDLPASRLNEAFGRVLRSAPAPAFPDAPRRALPELERKWWRERVRATWRAADADVRFPDFDAYFDGLFSYFASPTAWVALPGAREALDRLRAEGRRLGVVSNFDLRLLGLLRGLGLSRWLDCVVLPADAGAAKPEARIFELALQRLETPPSRAVYVGDDPSQDLVAAKQLGMRAIDVATLATLAELPRRVARLEQEGT